MVCVPCGPDVIVRFCGLERQAQLQQQTAHQLSAMYQGLQATRTTLTDMTEEMEEGSYEDVHELEASIKHIQVGGA